MRSSILTAVIVPAAALLIGVPRVAAASQDFPAEVQKQVPSLPCVPQCTLCHNQIPGLPPANKPFALKLKAASPIVQRDTASVATALQKLKAAGSASDADMDGKSDWDELAAGDDPNSSDATSSLCSSSPMYGCGATIARTPSGGGLDPAGALIAALAALGGLFVLRRKRQPR